jgi:T-complex protein 1 subunit beta
LTSELLREAEKLVSQKIHPQTIVEGIAFIYNFIHTTLLPFSLCAEMSVFRYISAHWFINYQISSLPGYRLASQAAFNALSDSTVDNRYFINLIIAVLNFSANSEAFKKDLINIAKTTLSSKVLNENKNHFAELAVNAVLRLKGSTNLEHIQMIKKVGGRLSDSYLDEGFILNKKIGVNCPKRMENVKILVANTRMCMKRQINEFTLSVYSDGHGQD